MDGRWKKSTCGGVIFLTSSLPSIILFVLGLTVGVSYVLQLPISCTQDLSRSSLVHCLLYGAHTVEKDEDGSSIWMFYNYYPWISLALMAQSVLFSLPGVIWNNLCSGKIPIDEGDINGGNRQNYGEQVISLVEYILSSGKSSVDYLCKHVLCELVSVFNLLLQVFLMNRFLKGQFLSLGLKPYRSTVYTGDMGVIDYTKFPMDYLNPFPRLVRCSMKRFHFKGDVLTESDLCLLPLNPLHESVYLFLWYFLLIAMVGSGALLIFRGLLLISCKVRNVVLRFQCPAVPSYIVETVSSRSKLGSWFVIYSVSSRVSDVFMQKLLLSILQEKNVKRLAGEIPTVKQNECESSGL